MNPQIATVVYLIFILVLFWFDRERKKTSWVLWIPTLWLLITGSRPVSLWLAPHSHADPTSLEGSPIDAMVFGILLLVALGVLVRRWRQTARFLRANAPVLLFFAYCAISIFWSDYSFVAFKRWTKAIGDLAIVLVVITDLEPTVAIQRVLARMAFLLLPLSVLLIKYFPDIGRSYNPWTGVPFYGGVTTFKNQLGETCLVAGLGSVWCFVMTCRERKGRDRLRHLAAHAIIIGMAIYLFLIANSVTSFSCFVFGSTLIVLTSLRLIRRRPAAVHLLVSGLIALALCAIFLPGANLVQSVGRDSTLTGRTAIWAASMSVVRSPLIGAGFESFWTGDRLTRIWTLIDEPGIQEAHNGYLEVYLNLGWLGVILLTVLIIGGYRNIMTVFRQDRKAGTIRLALFTGGLIFSFTEAGFRMMSPIWIAFLLAIMAVPASKRRKDRAVAGGKSTVREPVEIGIAHEDAIEAI
jgi:exopolysaccharide production protein ExoQ